MLSANVILLMWYVPVLLTVGLPLIILTMCSVDRLSQVVFSKNASRTSCCFVKRFVTG